MTRDRRVVDWDHHDPLASSDRPAFIARTLEHPVFWTERHGGFWVVTPNALVHEVHADPAVFSSAKHEDGRGGITIPEVAGAFIPPELDPPEHGRIRAILRPLFTWRSVLALRPIVQEIVDEALDRALEDDEFDIATLTHHIPSELICCHVGFDDELRATFVASIRRLFDLTTTSADAPDPEFLEVYGRLQTTTGALLAARREQPRGDVASLLVAVDDPPLTEAELFSLCMVLYVGGTDNVSSMMANTLVLLDEDRDLRERLTNEPGGFEAIYKELMRYISVSPGLARTITRDTVLGGVQMRAGERLFASLWGANFDPTVWDDPHRLDPDRANLARAMPFGYGIHACLGVGLTRLQTSIVLESVLRRMPDYQVDHSRSRRVRDAHTIYGWETVPAATC